MPDQRIYPAGNLNLQDLTGALMAWFRGQSYEAQTFQAPEGAMVVQARKSGGWRTLVGMSAALNVTLKQQADVLIVELSAAQWTDKAVVGAVGALVFFPLLVPAAYGAWQQQQLPSQVYRFIDQYVAMGGQSSAQVVPNANVEPFQIPGVAAQAQPEAHCPVCDTAVRQGAKFCDSCGAKLQQMCGKCGKELRAGAKFCDNCGQAVGA
jgi:hypothetical protein